MTEYRQTENGVKLVVLERTERGYAVWAENLETGEVEERREHLIWVKALKDWQAR